MNTLARVLPAPVLRVLRGRHSSVKARFWYNPLELTKLGFYRITGRSYLEWYSQRLDGFTKHESLHKGDRLNGRYFISGGEDAEVLVAEGLRPNNTLFEFGAGFGRSAQHFVRYLDADRYFGNDISKERLRQCGELFEIRGLLGKNPTLIHTMDNSFEWLEGRTFDFLWSAHVFVHMPPQDIDEVFRNIGIAMHDESTFLFTYSENEKASRRRHHAKDWDYNFSMFEEIAKKYGYELENITSRLTKVHRDRTKLARLRKSKKA